MAVSTIKSLPREMPPSTGDDPFIRAPEKLAKLMNRVEIDVAAELTNRPILRREIKDHPVLSGLSILSEPQGTNFEVTPEQDIALRELIEERTGQASPENVDVGKILPAVTEAFEATGLRFSRMSVGRFVASLLGKRFVILTGLTGSGKTKLALAFAVWLGGAEEKQVLLVPVGADWTSREPLLGYPDALSPGEYRLPASGVLQLVQRAHADPERPYFLILDEMNLSHVERYFADFLSAMESDQPIPLHEDAQLDKKDWGRVPHETRLPPNLFVVGTVNIDETTYLFSPKVLDRAHVIDFTVSKEDIDAFMQDPRPVVLRTIAGGGAGYARAFVEAAGLKVAPLAELASQDGKPVRETLARVLGEFFAPLAEHGAEFGYRTAYEVTRFVYFYAKVTGDGWRLDEAIDAAVYQKLLPKLHGSKTKLKPVLSELLKLCAGAYPLSAVKIKRMLARLERDGVASFAEA